ncbi:MAG: hypothetical protein HYX94_05030 [Chloroflexi bacterium]|nr:hypothetical protein [Chloroflexota bacterium]
MALGLALASVLASTAAAGSPWLAASPLPFTTAYHSLLASGDLSHLVVVGGDIGSGPLDKVVLAQLQPDGSVDRWQPSSYDLPQSVAEHATVRVGGMFVVIGGTNGQSAMRTIFPTEDTNAMPTGPWRSASTLLPVAVRGQAALAVGSTVFIFGGRDEGGKVSDQVYRTVVDADLGIGMWQNWGSLPQSMAYESLASADRRVYLMGGENDKGPVQDVYLGAFGPAGEIEWSRQPPLPRPLSRGAAFVSGEVLYYLGGYDGEQPSAKTYAAPMNADGSLGDWREWIPLPGGRMAFGATLLNGRAYVAGGFDGARFLDSLLYLQVDSASALPPVPGSSPANRLDILRALVLVSALVAIAGLVVVPIGLLSEWRSRSPGRTRKQGQDSSRRDHS